MFESGSYQITYIPKSTKLQKKANQEKLILINKNNFTFCEKIEL